MCVDEGPAVFVAHGCLELVDPDAGVNGEGFAFDGFEPCGIGVWMSAGRRK